MTRIWQTIKRWLETNAPQIHKDLLPGASAGAIAKAEKEIGIKFPADFKQSLAICDGQNGAAAPLLGDWQLISLKVIIRKWTILQKIFSGDQTGLSAEEKAALWNEKWVPIAFNGAGDYLCLDLSDKTGASKGRVITYWRSREERKAVADSFKELLETFANDLKAGKYRYEDEAMVKTK